MDYFGMAKRAWEITWRYKVLWLFGFLAGAGSYSSSGNFRGYSSGSGDLTSEQNAQLERAMEWVLDNIAIIVGMAVLLAIIGICLWVLSIAARGGLIHLASNADEGIAPTVREGFGAGFHFWGRVFLTELAIYLPFLIVVMLIVVPTVVLPVLAAIKADGSGSVGGGIAAIFGMIGILIVEVIVFSLIGVVLGIVEQLALRHGVLGGRGAIDSIGTAFHDVRTRFIDVFVMWLVTMGIGIVVAVAFGVVAAMFAVVIAGAAFAGAWPVAVLMGVVMALVFVVPGAIVATFYSTFWTLFYRRLTGRDGSGITASPAPVPGAWPVVGEPQPAPGPQYEPPTDFLPPPPSQPAE